MRNIWTIARREYAHFFITPIAYVVAVTILLVIGVVFITDIVQFSFSAMQSFGQAPTAQNVTGVFTFMLMLTLPALTMRAISEESRAGTLELLLTAPLRDFELLAGKWLGCLLLVGTILVISLIYPLVLNLMVEPGLDLGMLFTGYLGTILVAAAFLGLGVGMSAVFPNQIAAFLVTLLTFVGLWWLAGIPAQVLQSSATSELLHYLDMPSHFYQSFNAGTFSLVDMVYFLSLAATGLFIGTMAVELRRWR